VEGTSKPLVSERDQNFLVDTGQKKYVLKISNVAEDRGLIDLQNAAWQHIAATDPALGVPRLVRTAKGAGLAHWDSAAGQHMVRLLSYLEGDLFSSAAKTPGLFASLGAFMGRLSRALVGFGHPAAHRPGFMWNLDEAASLKPWLADIVEEENRAIASRLFARYEARVLPRLARLRAAVLHQDANDNNIIVDSQGEVCGLIDFGDMCFGRQIDELAVVLAYALLDEEDIYGVARPVIVAYAKNFPLDPAEADVLFDLVIMRLVASVCISSRRAREFPDNEYLLISQAPAFRLLARFERTRPELLAAFARDAAGLPAVPSHDAVCAWLASGECNLMSVFDFDLNRSTRLALSLKDGAPGMEHAASAAAYWAWLQTRMKDEGARFALGFYGEVRDVYRGDQFRTPASPEWRSQHLGVDIFIAEGTPIYAPLPGHVANVADNAERYGYGPLVILEHQTSGGERFWTLYGHLARETLARLTVGQSVAAGERIGSIGEPEVNGGWAPHLHFQIITDRLGLDDDFPGVGQPSLWNIWSKISPDPNLILRLAPESHREDADPPRTLLKRRAQVLGPSLSISYRNKLKIVRGAGSYLFDHTGRAYIDGVNNICHVGHSHPHVVEAMSRQATILNTNTRYLHNTILDYAERLASKFPKQLSIVYMVCSGSEANELALRMARTVTGRTNIVTLDWGYHGNTGNLIDVSPYKFNRKGGRGKPGHVEIAALPDPYRGPHKGYGEDAGHAYAASVAEQIAKIEESTGQGPAAFIAEAISGCGGQVLFPSGYLREAAKLVRAAGGLMIVDEVQTGFGRIGSHLWAHELQDVVPDIVTLGKPIGNGHPMAAVITTPEIAKAFANGMEFFSSFGGNPVSAAVGMAVLDVLERERLQDNALQTGAYLMERLSALALDHPLIGDVRGAGLFIGVELVRNSATLEPATEEASDLVNRAREMGVLLSTDGPFDNVIKIKPPLAFARREAEIMSDVIAAALTGLGGGT
jgi:hypothetical protein